MTNRYAFRLMNGGRKPLRWIPGALTVVLIGALSLPVGAGAQNNEYDLNLPGAGSGGSSESGGSTGSESTAPAGTPTAPAVTTPGVTTPTETTDATETTTGAGGGKKQPRKPDRREGPTDPVLTTSGVNATAGPQEIPTLRVEADDDGGVPTLALVLALAAAACCILALWRLRFLRELPAAPRAGTPRAEAS